MKKIIKYLNLLFVASLFVFVSCDKNDDRIEYGAPEISYVITHNWSDTITNGKLEDWITLLGNNFVNVKSVKINDLEIAPEDRFVKKDEITFMIPKVYLDPTTISNLITVETDKGMASIKFYIELPDPIPTRNASWLFDDPSNIFKAEIGNPLIPGWKKTIPTADLSGFVSVEGPAIPMGNKAIKVDKYYLLAADHGINPNGGGSRVNEYTIMIDFKVPSIGSWYSFLQTNPANLGDADVFINTGGKIGNGDTGYSSVGVQANKWQRLVISVKLGENGWLRYYLDGAIVLNCTKSYEIDNSRYSLEPRILFLADDDGDDALMEVAEIAMWDIALKNDQIPLLDVKINENK